MLFPIPGIFFQALGQIAIAAPWIIPQSIGFFLGCGHGMVYPAMNALMFERAGAGDRGSGNALFTGAVDAGTFGGSFLCGIIAGGYGLQPCTYTQASQRLQPWCSTGSWEKEAGHV